MYSLLKSLAHDKKRVRVLILDESMSMEPDNLAVAPVARAANTIEDFMVMCNTGRIEWLMVGRCPKKLKSETPKKFCSR